MAVHVGAGLGGAQRIRQGPGWAVAGRPDDLVHPSAAGSDERIVIGAENGGQPVGAVAGVLADAAVVEDRHLLAGVGVAAVGDPRRVFRVAEPVRVAGPVAGGLDRGGAAAAQRELRRGLRRDPQVAPDGRHVRDQVGAVAGGLDRGGQADWARQQIVAPGRRLLGGATRSSTSCSAATASVSSGGQARPRLARSRVAASTASRRRPRPRRPRDLPPRAGPRGPGARPGR